MSLAGFTSRPDRVVSGSRWSSIALAVLTLLAAALRLHTIAARSFWYDEGISVEVARLAWGDFARLLWVREGNMAVYYVLLRGWMLFGSSEFWLRSLSALFGVVTIPLLYSLGRRLFSERVGVVAAALLALNVAHIAYSQQARSYSLTVLCATLSLLCFVLHVESGGSRWGAAWSVSSAIAVYAHLFGGLVVLAEILSLFLLGPSDFSWRNSLRHVRYWIYMLIPMIAFVVYSGGGQLNWLSPVTASYFSYFLTHLTGNGGYLLLFLYAAASFLAAWIFLQVARREGRSVQLWRHALIWLAWFVPVASVLLAGLWRPLFLLRYLLICLPGLILVAAVGICSVKWSWASAATVALIAVLSLSGARAYYTSDFDLGRDDWRSATRFLLDHAQPGDTILFYLGPGRMTYEYYRSLFNPAVDPRVIYPAHAQDRVTWSDFQIEPLGVVFDGLPSSSPRIWLFLNQYDQPEGNRKGVRFMRRWCETHYQHLEATQDFPRIELLLYTK